MILKVMLVVGSVAVFGIGCVSATGNIAPSLPLNAGEFFLEQTRETHNADDFKLLHKDIWGYETELKHNHHKKLTVNTCADLVTSIDLGYEASQSADYGAVIIDYKICKSWQELSLFKPSHQSYLSVVNLDQNFAKRVPPQLALIISKDDERRLVVATNWDEMSHIVKVEAIDETSAIFVDNSGGSQRLNIRAKGDYNGDGIEDMLLSTSNTVEGGSYHSVDYFILTRLSSEASFTLLKQW
jgi:hypothetical protein